MIPDHHMTAAFQFDKSRSWDVTSNSASLDRNLPSSVSAYIVVLPNENVLATIVVSTDTGVDSSVCFGYYRSTLSFEHISGVSSKHESRGKNKHRRLLQSANFG